MHASEVQAGGEQSETGALAFENVKMHYGCKCSGSQVAFKEPARDYLEAS